MTLIVNFVGGPGCGKSTTAAKTFALLKEADINSELIQEYAKELSWIKDFKTLGDQYYVTGVQNHRQYILNGEVKVMVTDSPIIIGLLYYVEKNKKIKNLFERFVVEKYKSQNNITYFIKRTKKYNPKGRNQTEAEAKQKDSDAKNLLDKYKIPYRIIEGNKLAARTVVHDIREILNGME
jgi:ABC-type dipeptide/oligopeptide/nickel transport system ATPase component